MGTKKTFDAVAESRKWRIATGKELSAMTEEERLAHLNRGIAEKLEALGGTPRQTKAKRTRKAKRSTFAH
ncbi:MAG: hypothetical protein ACQKBU_01870 [Verrucomicrobiales bacterium]